MGWEPFPNGIPLQCGSTLYIEGSSGLVVLERGIYGQPGYMRMAVPLDHADDFAQAVELAADYIRDD